MKFATAKEHRDFFQKRGWIEFEGLLSNEQLALANQAIDQVLAERLNVSPHRLHSLSPEKIYLQGRDVWRAHPILHKWATQTRFAEIVAELIEKRALRLGYDQVFFAYSQMFFENESSSAYSRFLKQMNSLETVSCLQGVACGCIFALNDRESPPEEKEASAEGIDIFPNQAGNVIIFQPNVPIRWNDLCAHAGQRFYLLVYTLASAYYYLQPQDPHTHNLKRLGYVFNDRLNDKLHPIVYR